MIRRLAQEVKRLKKSKASALEFATLVSENRSWFFPNQSLNKDLVEETLELETEELGAVLEILS